MVYYFTISVEDWHVEECGDGIESPDNSIDGGGIFHRVAGSCGMNQLLMHRRQGDVATCRNTFFCKWSKKSFIGSKRSLCVHHQQRKPLNTSLVGWSASVPNFPVDPNLHILFFKLQFRVNSNNKIEINSNLTCASSLDIVKTIILKFSRFFSSHNKKYHYRTVAQDIPAAGEQMCSTPRISLVADWRRFLQSAISTSEKKLPEVWTWLGR